MLLFYCALLNELMIFEGVNFLDNSCVWRLAPDSVFRVSNESEMTISHNGHITDPLLYDWELIGVMQ